MCNSSHQGVALAIGEEGESLQLGDSLLSIYQYDRHVKILPWASADVMLKGGGWHIHSSTSLQFDESV